MTLERMRLLRILGLAVLLFAAAGQLLDAADQLLVRSASAECEHHADGAAGECPAEQSCCHAHGSSLVLAGEASGLPGAMSRSLRFFVPDESLPEGCLREIDYPPQLS